MSVWIKINTFLTACPILQNISNQHIFLLMAKLQVAQVALFRMFYHFRQMNNYVKFYDDLAILSFLNFKRPNCP